MERKNTIGKGRLGMMTKRVNVFNQTLRKIRCVKKTHDYLGNGNIIVEEQLEVGNLYTFVGGVAESYGNMVLLEELPSDHGYHAYLFEELEEYDESILLCEQEKWITSRLDEGMEDIRAERYVPAKDVFEKIRHKI